MLLGALGATPSCHTLLLSLRVPGADLLRSLVGAQCLTDPVGAEGQRCLRVCSAACLTVGMQLTRARWSRGAYGPSSA